MSFHHFHIQLNTGILPFYILKIHKILYTLCLVVMVGNILNISTKEIVFIALYVFYLVYGLIV